MKQFGAFPIPNFSGLAIALVQMRQDNRSIPDFIFPNSLFKNRIGVSNNIARETNHKNPLYNLSIEWIFLTKFRKQGFWPRDKYRPLDAEYLPFALLKMHAQKSPAQYHQYPADPV